MELPSILYDNQDIIFKILEQQSFDNISAHSAIIKNSIINECSFTNVDMSNADLLSTKIYTCKFISVNFEDADLFSLWFSNCTFINTNFDTASIEDITFENCQFENCSFDEVNLKNCSFNKTAFVNLSPESSTFSLNSYSNCNFTKCKFKGSFIYQIFTCCSFNGTKIDCDLLKYNYGIGNHVETLYLYKGEIVKLSKTLMNQLISDCVDQKLLVNAVFVNYNFEKEINPDLAIKSLYALKSMIKNDILLRNDELIFLKNLYHSLYKEKLLAPIILYKLYTCIIEIYNNKIDNISYEKCKSSLNVIANSLYFDFSDFCDQLKEKIKSEIKYVPPVYIKIHYKDEPQVQLSTLLNLCLPDTFLRIETQHGSFIEDIIAGAGGLEVFKIFIQLLGIAAPIIYSEFKEKRKKHTDKKSIKKEVEINISQKNNDDAALLIQKTCQMLETSDILQNDIKGYNNQNISEIHISYKINIQA